jgi:hypothetical protein
VENHVVDESVVLHFLGFVRDAQTQRQLKAARKGEINAAERSVSVRGH